MFELLFHRRPLEKVWIKLQKYERALSPINTFQSRQAKCTAGGLRSSLQRELDRRRSRGACSVQGIGHIVNSFNIAMVYIRRLVQSPGLNTHQQQKICKKAISAAQDLSQAVDNLAHAVPEGSVKVSDPRNKCLEAQGPIS